MDLSAMTDADCFAEVVASKIALELEESGVWRAETFKLTQIETTGTST